MVDQGWNVYMNPPLYQEITSPEVFTELIHSIKASQVCEKPAKVLADCRKRPEGKLTNPEKCQSPAINLINCYQAVQTVPAACNDSYNSVLNCLKNKGSCTSMMDSYLSCSHPAASKY